MQHKYSRVSYRIELTQQYDIQNMTRAETNARRSQFCLDEQRLVLPKPHQPTSHLCPATGSAPDTFRDSSLLPTMSNEEFARSMDLTRKGMPTTISQQMRCGRCAMASSPKICISDLCND